MPNKESCPALIDIREDDLLELSAEVLDTLLRDHTTGKNIFWATHDYEALGSDYDYHSQILPTLITGEHGMVIRPRVLKSKENQNKRAWEEVDRLRSKPPEIRYEYRYKDKCATCRIDERTKRSMSSWRYARFLTIMLIVCIVSELIQSTAFLRDLLAFSIVLLKACSYILIGPLYSGYYLVNLSGWLQDNSKLYTFGQIVQFLLPTIIYVTYFLLWKFALPLFLEWVRKKKTKRHEEVFPRECEQVSGLAARLFR